MNDDYLQLCRDYAARIVLDSGSWKAGQKIKAGEDDGHYIMRHMMNFYRDVLSQTGRDIMWQNKRRVNPRLFYHPA